MRLLIVSLALICGMHATLSLGKGYSFRKSYSSSKPSSSSKSYSSGKSSSSTSSNKPPPSPSKTSSSSSNSNSGSSWSWFKPSNKASRDAAPSYSDPAAQAKAKEESAQKWQRYKAAAVGVGVGAGVAAGTTAAATPEPAASSPQTTKAAAPTAPLTTTYAPPPVYQVDTKREGISPWFWAWLLSNNTKGPEWAYHHRDQLTDTQYQELLQKNAALKSKVEELERSNTPKDPNYTVPTKEIEPTTEEKDSDSNWLEIFLISSLGVGAVTYLVFFKRWRFK